MTPVYDDAGIGVQYMEMLSSLSGVRLIFIISPYLNIISISSDKWYSAENTD